MPTGLAEDAIETASSTSWANVGEHMKWCHHRHEKSSHGISVIPSSVNIRRAAIATFASSVRASQATLLIFGYC